MYEPVHLTCKAAFKTWKASEWMKSHLDNDVIISATKVLEQAATEIIAPRSPCIAIVKIHHQDSHRAIAFVVPHILHQWGSHCRQDNGLLLNPPPEGSFDQRILWI